MELPITPCAGSLLSSDTVLTAAHCVYQYTILKKEILEKVNLLFTVGEHDKTKDDKTEQKMKARDIIIHPNYKNGSRDFDFAIIKLAKPVKFTKFVVPVCLPSNKHQKFESNEAKVAGWGRQYFEQPDENSPKVLRKVDSR